MAPYYANSLEMSVERNQRTLIKLLLGTLCAVVLFVFLCWGGWHYYARFEARHLVRRAAAYLGAGDLKDASLSARRALQLDPNRASTVRMVARIAEVSGDRRALDWRQKVLELEPRSVEDALALANCALQFGEAEIARRSLESVDDTEKQMAAYHATAARLADAEKKPVESEAAWAKAVELSPEEKPYQLQLALCQLKSADKAKREKARTLLEHLRNDPGQRAAAVRALIADTAAHEPISETLLNLGQELQSYPEARFTDRILYLDILKQSHDRRYTSYLTQLENEAANNTSNLANLLAWMNNAELSLLAIDFLKTVPPEVSKKWPVAPLVSEAYLQLRDWPELEQLTSNGNWGEFDYLRRAYLARAFRAQDKSVAAEREWFAAQKAAAAQPHSLLTLARTISKWQWKDEATDLLWTLTKFPREQREALNTLYQHYKETKNTQGLYRVLLRLAEVDPADLKVQNNLAQISLLLNANVGRARQIAADLYRKQPSNAAYVSTYAFSLYAKGDAKGAVALMNTLGEDECRDPSLAAYYGIMLAAAGDQTRAREYLQIGKNANLLPEEKLLIDRAQIALGHHSDNG